LNCLQDIGCDCILFIKQIGQFLLNGTNQFKTRTTNRTNIRVPHLKQDLLTLLESPLLICLNGIRVVHVVKLYVFTHLIPSCDVRYDFCIKRYLILLDSHFFCMGSWFIYVICIYLSILLSNAISISWCVCHLTVTRWVLHVEKELFRSTRVHPRV
jgi:hypothetical protein